jgi:hypothetical protein
MGRAGHVVIIDLRKYLSTLLPNEIVTDAQVIQDYYPRRHNARFDHDRLRK